MNSGVFRRVLIFIIIIICSILILTYLILVDIKQNILFYPTTKIHWYPSKEEEYIGNFKDLFIDSGNRKINVWYFNLFEDRPIILYSHGNYGNMSYRKMIFDLSKILEMNLIMYDYYGYGASNGNPSLDQFHLDARSVYKYVRNGLKFNPNEIYILGKSLGGYASLSIASSNTVRSVVTICTFNKFEDVIENDNDRSAYILKKITNLMTNNFEQNNDFVKKITVPCVFLHSKSDSKIPFINSQKLYDNCLAFKKKFIEIQGDHTSIEISYDQFIQTLLFAEYPINDLLKTKEFHEQIRNWLTNLPYIINSMTKEMDTSGRKGGITSFIGKNIFNTNLY